MAYTYFILEIEERFAFIKEWYEGKSITYCLQSSFMCKVGQYNPYAFFNVIEEN